MLKSNNFQNYSIFTFAFLNIKIPSFSFLKKAILGLHKNLFWYISRKIGKIWENFQKVPFKALLKQQKIWEIKQCLCFMLFEFKNFPKIEGWDFDVYSKQNAYYMNRKNIAFDNDPPI